MALNTTAHPGCAGQQFLIPGAGMDGLPLTCGTPAFGTKNDTHVETAFADCCGENPIALYSGTIYAEKCFVSSRIAYRFDFLTCKIRPSQHNILIQPNSGTAILPVEPNKKIL